jgi:hypothetical protein
MSRQIDLTAYLHIGYGALILLAALIATVVIIGGGQLADDPGAVAITTGVGAVVGVILAVLSLPSIIGGFGLLKRRPWSRTVIIVLSILHLFSFPIGTAIGAYSLYVLFQDDARAEFEYGHLH